MTQDTDIVNGFIRQRRALIVISLMMVLYEKLGIEIETINILGNTALINNPLNVTNLAWIGWGYFLVRYYQYFRDLGDKGFTGAYNAKLNKLTEPCVRKKFGTLLFQNREKEFPGEKRPFKIEFREVSLLRNLWNNRVYKIDVAVFFTEPGATTTSQNLKNREVSLLWSELLVPHIRSGWHVLANTRLISEYILPFGIALLALIYGPSFPIWQ